MAATVNPITVGGAAAGITSTILILDRAPDQANLAVPGLALASYLAAQYATGGVAQFATGAALSTAGLYTGAIVASVLDLVEVEEDVAIPVRW